MPRRNAEHMAAQRERILRAVFECIAERGVERTSIADIRRRAGLSAGALYVHFSNKDEMVAEALRYGSMTEATLPDSWPEFLKVASSLRSQLGFDIATVARIRLHMHAESVRPGPLHDLHRPILERNLDLLAERLAHLAHRGEIRLKMSPRQTAVSISALIDGALFIGLATDRPLKELEPEIQAALACLVETPQPSPKSPPPRPAGRPPAPDPAR